jgi:hypothetical protein
MYIAAKIHNNKLGACLEVSSEEEGIKIVKEWAESMLGRSLNEEEDFALNNDLEIFNEDDLDNIWCYSIGMVE